MFRNEKLWYKFLKQNLSSYLWRVSQFPVAQWSREKQNYANASGPHMAEIKFVSQAMFLSGI